MTHPATAYRFQVPALSQVRITGGFWQQWQTAIREGSIPSVLDFLKSTGRVDAIKEEIVSPRADESCSEVPCFS